MFSHLFSPAHFLPVFIIAFQSSCRAAGVSSRWLLWAGEFSHTHRSCLTPSTVCLNVNVVLLIPDGFNWEVKQGTGRRKRRDLIFKMVSVFGQHSSTFCFRRVIHMLRTQLDIRVCGFSVWRDSAPYAANSIAQVNSRVPWWIGKLPYSKHLFIGDSTNWTTKWNTTATRSAADFFIYFLLLVSLM